MEAGIVLIDKDAGLTSFDAVSRVRKKLGVDKAGHAGTLDKSASGLLIVCINGGTSFQNILMSQDKRYVAGLYTGIETDTLDRYGLIRSTGPLLADDPDAVEAVLADFTGDIEQVPPVFSSVHVGGERSYLRALGGRPVSPKTRRVRVTELSLREHALNHYTLEALVSKGTYMRSLARDIARRLGTCGYLESLRRTAVGLFLVENASRVHEDPTIIPIEEALAFVPEISVTERQARLIRNGVPLTQVFEGAVGPLTAHPYTRLLRDGRTIAVAEGKTPPRYFKVFGDTTRAHR